MIRADIPAVRRVPLSALAMGSMVEAFGVGIAAAQQRLDFASLRLARAMGGLDPAEVSTLADGAGEAGKSDVGAVRFPSGRSYNLLELGFTPSFYRFTEAVFELKVAMSVSLEETSAGSSSKSRIRLLLLKRAVKVSAVNGQYASRYQYACESSSRIRSKIVSVPAPNLLEARVAAMLAQRRPQDQVA
jgi:hypothetical protein